MSKLTTRKTKPRPMTEKQRREAQAWCRFNQHQIAKLDAVINGSTSVVLRSSK